MSYSLKSLKHSRNSSMSHSILLNYQINVDHTLDYVPSDKPFRLVPIPFHQNLMAFRKSRKIQQQREMKSVDYHDLGQTKTPNHERKEDAKQKDVRGNQAALEESIFENPKSKWPQSCI